MAGLPLYLMAIPLRRSLAAGMDLRGERLQKLDRYNVEALKLYSGRAPSLHALQQFAIVGQALRLPHLGQPMRSPYNNFSRVKSCESTIPTGTLSSSITTRSSMR